MGFYLGILYAVGAMITWGINSHILKAGARNEHPLMAMVYRAIVSLPILLVLTIVFRGWGTLGLYLDQFNLLMTLLLVLSIIMGDAIFIYAMKKYEVSVILPIATSYPLLTSIILIIFGIEDLTSLIIGGTIAVVIGIYLVTKYRFNEETQERGISIEALLLGIGVSFGWGISVIFARIILDQSGTESLGLMTVRTLIIGFLAFSYYFSQRDLRLEYREKSNQQKIDSFKIFGLSGIFGWVLGATFLFLALENIQAAIATPISASNPIIAVLIGQLTGIDKINLKQLLGILITVGGVILIII